MRDSLAGLPEAARRPARRRHRRRPGGARARPPCSTRAASGRWRRWASARSRSTPGPRVAILSTGNEIVDPGQPLGAGQIYDINRFTLASIVGLHGGVPIVYPTVPGHLAALTQALDTARGEDIVVFSGGSSVGERDLMQDVIASRGEMIFHGIAVKPGKPTAFGQGRRHAGLRHAGLPDVVPVQCLHPAGAAAPPHRPAARRTSRGWSARPLARRVVSTTGRHQFYTVRLEGGTAVPAFKASGDITSMSHADGYIEIPAHTDIVEAGELVDVKLF